MIEYVAVHKMVHLVQPDHNQDFWNRVAHIIPDWQERKSWLAKNGAIYDLWNFTAGAADFSICK